ncbi:adenylate/guanylate cyclase domain-containing protein [Microvirga pudoricolor]|uniref:adenylate/guanylate cyclase domain-containing protein n=1 Tax=Microvirga pudoricolor TaxID=2778729 RepID=UPI0019503B9F|nr:adenylate/guanylate cyclase domain-containing protein [Microvirga pudoricolor]MBM6594071.1 adenylate/guanylate cyclase domain-containing protein [Microvirga pudoricolor]
MNEAQANQIAQAMTEAGLVGASELDLLRDFCGRLIENGLPISRANVLIDTLHPIHEGRVFRWRCDESDQAPMVEYGRSTQGGQVAQSWQRSPFYALVQSGENLIRRSLKGDGAFDFPILDDLKAEGQTDFVAMIHRFAADGVIGEMDCVYSSWATDHPDGFSDAQVDALCRLVPSLALAAKCTSLARIAETLVETYLGRDAGRRVLSGRIERGVTDRIEAVLWFSDLRSFTHITETAEPEQIIPFLNDYAEAIISSVHEAGGDVLKLIGDGTLAIFNADRSQDACRCALHAEKLMRARVADLNAERTAEGLPVTEAYLGLHIGEVFYGNIGSHERLDFTVVGPAVNEATRIAALCRSVEKDVLISSAFAAAAAEAERQRIVSVGRFALKGIKRPRELFTLEPEDEASLQIVQARG